jgi:hypothetical protein
MVSLGRSWNWVDSSVRDLEHSGYSFLNSFYGLPTGSAYSVSSSGSTGGLGGLASLS